MALRRSARVKSGGVDGDGEQARVIEAKYEKVTKGIAAPKKRKSRASVSAPIAAADPSPNRTAENAVPEPPSTPLPKKRKAAAKSPAKPPPSTPTPSAIGLLRSTYTTVLHPLEEFPSLAPRPAEPHTTNAPLSTPNGSHVVAYTSSSPIKHSDPSPVKRRKAREVVPPDVGAIPAASTDIELLLLDAEKFLVGVDPKLAEVVGRHHCRIFSPEGLREVVDPFTALSSGIIGQQVSGQAAASIRTKFTALFPESHPGFPSPAQVIAKDLPTLRTAGLSQRKAEYISGLAEKFTNGDLTAQMLVSATDEELIEKLVAVRGLGRWSVEMFACFGLKRMDVFSTGDLGVQRGMAAHMGRDISKLKGKGGKWKYMSEQEMLDIASRFSPYRSLFMWYMWRIADVDVSVMKKT